MMWRQTVLLFLTEQTYSLVHDSIYMLPLQVKVKLTMETAFWDCVKESLTNNPPDYTWVIKLVEEVRNELVGLVPASWKQEILDSIDTDLLSQVVFLWTSI